MSIPESPGVSSCSPSACQECWPRELQPERKTVKALCITRSLFPSKHPTSPVGERSNWLEVPMWNTPLPVFSNWSFRYRCKLCITDADRPGEWKMEGSSPLMTWASRSLKRKCWFRVYGSDWACPLQVQLTHINLGCTVAPKCTIQPHLK